MAHYEVVLVKYFAAEPSGGREIQPSPKNATRLNRHAVPFLSIGIPQLDTNGLF